VQLVTSTANFTQSVPAALAQTAWLWETNEGERVMARQHPGTAVISEGHKEVVNIRTAGVASKCSASNAIRICILIRPNSLKPLQIAQLLFFLPIILNAYEMQTS